MAGTAFAGMMIVVGFLVSICLAEGTTAMQRARLGDVVVCLMVACLLALAQGASANPVIYQEDFSGPNGSQPAGFNNPNSPHWAQYANVKGQILGGEYEQRKTAVHPTPSVDDDSRVINYYNDADAIDTGA